MIKAWFQRRRRRELAAGPAWAGCAVAGLLALGCGGASHGERVIVVEPAGGQGSDLPESPSGAGPIGVGGEPGTGAAGEGGTGDAGGAGGVASAEPCHAAAENTVENLQLVSLSMTCGAADGDAAFSRLTADGRYVAFDSDAGDLTPNDRNGKSDAFLFDLQTRTLELISQHYEEARPADGYTFFPMASTDGRYVAFTSYSYELTKQLAPEGTWIYVRDRQTGTTRRFAATFACAYWLDMTPDAGTLVADGFSNCTGGIEDGDHDTAVAYQRDTGEATYLGADDGGDNYRPPISADGRFMVWGTRPPGTRGQFTTRMQHYDRETDTLQTLPLLGFHFGSIDLADSGQIVAFSLTGQVYRYDVETMDLTLVSRNASGGNGDGASDPVSISADGRFVVFASTATDLVDGDTNGASDVFLYDAEQDSLERISLAPDGSQADEASRRPHISADGTHITFVSKARNLLPVATAGNWQVYVLTR